MQGLRIVGIVLGAAAACTACAGSPAEVSGTSRQALQRCDQADGETGIQASIRVTDYRGLTHGRNGTHEVVFGTIISTAWVYDPSVIDTDNVQVAMNVQSETDSTGLPQEVRLNVNDVFEAKGTYKPASLAGGDNDGDAIVHFTHAPCGYVEIDGTKY